MFGIEALDVVIGMIFIYLLFSLFVSIVNEMLSQLLNVRGKELRFAIEKMIGYALRNKLYNYRKIDRVKYKSSFWYGTPFWGVYVWFKNKSDKISLSSNSLDKKLINKDYPSQISNETFVEAVIEIVKDDKLRKKLFVQAPFLEKIYIESNGNINRISTEIENWYIEVMAYTSEWYKQKLRYVLLALGFATAVIFNVDSISIFKTLVNDDEVRAQVVQQAQNYIDSHEEENGFPVKITADSTAKDTTIKGGYALRIFLEDEEDARLKNLTPDSFKSPKDSIRIIDSLKTQIQKELSGEYPTLVKLDSTYQNLDRLVSEDIAGLSSILGMGWKEVPKPTWNGQNLGAYFTMFFGWLITALAISLGAPFWFDLLKKVINLKNDLKGNSKKGDGAVG